VVAASNDDWKRIKKIIEEIDKPQKQVLLEILIADLTAEDTRLLGAMTRFPDKVPLPDQIALQAAHLGLQPMADHLPNPTTLNADLLQNAYKTADGVISLADPTSDGNQNVATFARAGTTMLSLNDNNGNTWSILELLQTFSHSKIISHPHIVATTNKEATITIGEQRYLTDAASGSLGGTTVITVKPINADLKVKITPRISTADVINLQISININDFIVPASSNVNSGVNTITVRTLETNANIRSGGIFALGGLIKNNVVNSVSETPFLSKVPVLGWFFKSRSSDVTQNNLTVFICPTIIEPRLRGGTNKHTDDYINLAKNYANEELFANLKDPVTHWFFPSTDNTDEQIDAFVDRCSVDEHSTAPVVKKPAKKPKPVPAVPVVPEKPVVVATNNTSTTALPDLKGIINDNDPNPFLKT